MRSHPFPFSLVTVTLAALVSVFAGGAFGCSTEHAGKTDAGKTDAGSVDSGEHDARDAAESGHTNQCTLTVQAITCPNSESEASTDAGPSTVGWCCPARFDAGDAAIPRCSVYEYLASCGDTWRLLRNWGTHRIECYYPAATGTLTGALTWDDLSGVCIAGAIQASEPCSNNSCIADDGAVAK